jgi:hypothetical protein
MRARRGARRFAWWAAGALACGLGLRLWLILRYAHVSGDTLLYGDLALNWLRHGVYGFSRGGGLAPRPTLIRLPGYPLFLAACFKVFGDERYLPVLLVQTAVDLWGCWLAAATARRLFGDRAFLPALWLGTLCPFTAMYVANPLTETWTLLCIALAFYGLVRWRESGGGINRWAGVLGAALAYAVLLRPEQGMLAACVVPAMVWMERGRLKAAVLVSLLTVLPLVPWTVRNERTFHVLQPLAPRYATDPGEANPYGFQRWYRTWAIDFASTEQVYWNYEGDEIHISDLPERAFDSQAQYDATASVMEGYNRTTTSTPALDGAFDGIAWERIEADPLRYYLALPVARLVNMALRPRAETLPLPLDWWRFRQHWGASVLMAGMAGLNLFYLCLGWLGWRRRFRAPTYERMRPVYWAMAGTILLRCLLLLTLDNSETRYTLEFFPVLVVLGSGWIAMRRKGYLQGVSLNS